MKIANALRRWWKSTEPDPCPERSVNPGDFPEAREATRQRIAARAAKTSKQDTFAAISDRRKALRDGVIARSAPEEESTPEQRAWQNAVSWTGADHG